LDNSKAMLKKARHALPQSNWVEHDAAGDLSSLGTFNLVFSNAALQWLPDHTRVVPGLFALLEPGGVLAVQLPHNYDNPVHLALRELAQSEVWRLKLPPSRFHPVGYYYDILSALTDEFELWSTTYHHVLCSHDDIIEWYKGTGFRPYLDQLDTPGQDAFLADMLARVRQLYTPQADGKILFDFERLFFIARRI